MYKVKVIKLLKKVKKTTTHTSAALLTLCFFFFFSYPNERQGMRGSGLPDGTLEV